MSNYPVQLLRGRGTVPWSRVVREGFLGERHLSWGLKGENELIEGRN